jgi:hypothetical protein
MREDTGSEVAAMGGFGAACLQEVCEFAVIVGSAGLQKRLRMKYNQSK